MTTVKKIGIILLLLLGVSAMAQAQGLLKRPSYHHLFMSLGPASYSGDLGEMKMNIPGFRSWELDNMRYNLSLGYRNWFYGRWSCKGILTYAKVAGTDQGAGRYQHARNFKFESDIFEAAAHLEYFFWTQATSQNRYAAYAFLGLGAGHVKANLMFTPRSTDKVKEKDFFLFFPAGVGFEYYFADTPFSIGLELQGQQAFTDYIDGIDSSSPSKFLDAVGMLNVTFSYNIYTMKGRAYCYECEQIWY